MTAIPAQAAPVPATPTPVAPVQPVDRDATGTALQASLLHATDATQAEAIGTRLERLRQSRLAPTVRLLLNRGQREAGRNQFRDAIADLDDAVALQPDQAPLWRERGVVKANAGDPDAAIIDLGGAINRDRTDVLSWSALSSVEEHHGRAAPAYAAWEHVLQLDPMIPGGAARLNHLRRLVVGDPT